MAASNTFTSIDPVLKVLYKGNTVQDLIYVNNRLWAVLPKFEDFTGTKLVAPVKHGNGGGRSSTFSDAQANTAAVAFDAWELTRVNNYAVGQITGEAIDASSNDRGAFVRGLKAIVDAKIDEFGRSLGVYSFRNGTGSLGAITYAGTPATSFTMTVTQDAKTIEIGDALVFSAAYDYAALRAGAGVVYVVGVNAVTGVVTCAATQGGVAADIAASVTAIATGDHVHIKGDAHAAGSAHKQMAGLMQWMPAAAPTGVIASASNPILFMGITDRSVSNRFYGQQLDASAYGSVEEAVIDGCSYAASLGGGEPDLFVCSPAKFRALVKELGSKVHYEKIQAQGAAGAIAHIGFRTVVIDGDNGPVKVMADRFCPNTYGWALDTSVLSVRSIGAAPKFLMEDGNRILRMASEDSYEFRLGFRGNMLCEAPGKCCNVTMP